MERNFIYEFGQFHLNTLSQVLWNKGGSVYLSPKVYRLLLYFLQHSDTLITHEELMEKVWDGRIVDNSALRFAVNTLRNALQDDCKTPKYILTVCKRGYRFLSMVNLKDISSLAAVDLPPLLTYPRIKIADLLKTNTSRGLKELQNAFELTLNCSPQLIFLRGCKNIGKTTLIDSFIATILHTKALIFSARCIPLVCNVEPFLPLVEALEYACQKHDGAALISTMHKLAPGWLNQMLNVSDIQTRFDAQITSNHLGRMLREGANFFEHLATESVIIIILENAQWSDQSSLDLLNFLSYRHAAVKLFIIISYRPHENILIFQQIESMREELMHRGLCVDIELA